MLIYGASQVVLVARNLTANRGDARDVGLIPESDLLEEEMATCSIILPWKIPRMEEPGELQSMGWPRAGHN